MEYILGMLEVVLCGGAVQRRLPADWRPYMRYVWLGLTLGATYALLTAPYRLARIAGDLAHWLK